MNWNKLENKKPLAIHKGGWDGLKSEPLLVCTRSGKAHVAVMYEGILDGNHFRSFYDQDDFEIHNVIYWTELDLPI